MRSPLSGATLQRWPPLIALWLAGAMCCVPFLVNRHYLPIPSFFNELAAVVLGLAACTMLLRRRYWQPWDFPAIGLLPLGLVLLLMLQVVAGRALFPQQNLLAALYLLWACCLIMLGAAMRRDLDMARIVAVVSGCILASAVLSALIALQQFLQVSTTLAAWLMPTKDSKVYGNIGQSNHLADLLAMGLASLLYLRATRALNPGLALVSALLLLFVMSLIGSRSMWLYLGAMAILVLWARGTRAHRHLMFEAWMLLPAFAVMQYLVNLPWVTDYGPVVTSTERFFHEIKGASPRLQLWQQAWSIFLHSPWLGVGFGRFPWMTYETASNGAELVYPEPSENAHNLVMNVLSEMGLPATLLLIVMAGAWCWRVVNGGYSVERWWLVAMAAVLGIHSMLEYPLWYAYFLGIAALLAGLGETSLQRPKIRFGRGLLLVALLLGWLSMANMTSDYMRMESGKRRAADGLVEKETLQQAKQALSEMSRQSLLSPYAMLVAAISLVPDRAHLREQLDICEVAQRFWPVKQVVFKYALLLALAGEQERAQRQLRMATAAYPGEAAGFNAIVRELESQGIAVFEPKPDIVDMPTPER